MFILSRKLREYRRKMEMTQEDAANALGVAPQTVSKWERGETLPDVTLLPALANLFQTTADDLLGMDDLREKQQIGDVYTRARVCLRQKEWQSAVKIYEEALSIWPNDAGIMTDLAMALALCGTEAELARAGELCERVLNMLNHIKVQHTARAALCYIRAKEGKMDLALQTAGQLSHIRESREVVRERLLSSENLNAVIYELSTGEMMQ